jgi:hypothetical protein
LRDPLAGYNEWLPDRTRATLATFRCWTDYELIGLDAVRRGRRADTADPPEVRVRVAGRTSSLDAAKYIGREVSALWLNGPAGGGGATRRTEQVVAIDSVLVPRHAVHPEVSLVEV